VISVSHVDLSGLLSPGASLYLTAPETINHRGEIAGVGLDVNGNQHAFVLIPCDKNHADVDGCDYSMVDAQTVAAVADAALVAPKPAQSNQLTHGFHAANNLMRGKFVTRPSASNRALQHNR
jgi:hypothetical protein